MPYAYALYVMLGVGGLMLYGLTSFFSWPDLLAGVFWVAVGYRILLGFGRLTEAKEDEKKAAGTA